MGQLLLIFLAIGLSGIALISQFEAFFALNAFTVSQSNHLRIEEAKDALKFELKQDLSTNVPYLPFGAKGLFYHELPINLPVAKNSGFGDAFHYCPYAPAEPLANIGHIQEVISPNGFSYKVEIIDGLAVRSEQKLLPEASQMGVVGFILSGRTENGTMPGCNDIQFRDGVFFVPGGVVKWVSRAQNFTREAVAKSGNIRMFVAPDPVNIKASFGAPDTFGAISQETATGSSTANPTTLDRALQFYRTHQPKRFTIQMANGLYQVNSQLLTGEKLKGHMNGSELIFDAEQAIIKATPPASQNAQTGEGASGVALWSLPGVVRFTSGISLDPSIELRVDHGAKYQFGGNQLGDVQVVHGTVVFNQSTVDRLSIGLNGKVIQNSGLINNINAEGGEVKVNGSAIWSIKTSSQNAGQRGHAATAIFENTDVSIAADLTIKIAENQKGIYVGHGTKFSLLPGSQLKFLSDNAYDTAVHIDHSGELNASKARLFFHGVFTVSYRIQGRLNLQDTLSYFPGVGLRSADALAGAELMLTGSSSLGMPGASLPVGVSDLGARYLAGTGRIAASQDCWQGELFTFSQDSGSQSGDYSKLVDRSPHNIRLDAARMAALTLNKANWNCTIS